MSKYDDDEDRPDGSTPDAHYTVGNKRPPREHQFKPGRSGNPSGRPRGRPGFGRVLLDELNKSVTATMNGEPVKVGNYRMFVKSCIKDGITKGPQSKALLINHVLREEARLAAEAAARSSAEDEKSAEGDEFVKFSWTREHEELQRELGEAIKRLEKENEEPPKDE